MKKMMGCIFDTLAPKWADKYVLDGECCLFFSIQLPSSVLTGNTLQVVVVWENQVFVIF